MKFPLKYWLPGGLFLPIILLEIILRFGVGLGHPPVVVSDSSMGYRFKENQKLRRFGNRLIYNQYSQRSEDITLQKDPETLRILMLGDSVLNGGNRKDQEEIISEQWKARIKSNVPKVEVLNAAANSWGIGNQLGYINKYGLFDSDAVVLQIGTHDLVQPTSTEDSLGDNQQPIFALQEAFFDYAWPRLRSQFSPPFNAPQAVDISAQPQPQQNQQKQQFQANLESFDAIAAAVRAQNIPLFVLYTPNRRDLQPNAPEPLYKAEFFQHLEGLGIPVVDSQKAWSKLPTETVENYFIDKVHLSVAGNNAIADLLFQQLCVTDKIAACQN